MQQLIEYPPRSSREAEILELIDVMGQHTARPVTYLSAPITTGSLLYKYVKASGLRECQGIPAAVLQSIVIAPNVQHAAEARSRLTPLLPGSIIDPSTYTFDGWSQSDYRTLWANVIERIAQRVVFVDGWEYSNGCAFEFLTAIRHRLETSDERLQPVTFVSGFQRLRNAASFIHDICGESDFLNHVLKDLQELSEPHGRT